LLPVDDRQLAKARGRVDVVVDIDDAADEMPRLTVVCADGQDIVEQLLALHPGPVVVPLVDGDGESCLAAGQESVDAGFGSFHA
jgi:hypothetical protein